MIILGAPVGDYCTDCPYIEGNSFRSENLLIREIDSEGLDYLLSLGFRHFGEHFFRPICTSCHQCIPIRVGTGGFRLSRNFKRLLAKTRGIRYEISPPEPSVEKYQLFLNHNRRFRQLDSAGYESFRTSFFHPFPFSRELRLYHGNTLIGISHFEWTERSLSAVYCYWDSGAAPFSPGTLAILKELEIAAERSIDYVYLGYYVSSNHHMNYKVRFRPNELLLTEDKWVPFIGEDGTPGTENAENHGFVPRCKILWDRET